MKNKAISLLLLMCIVAIRPLYAAENAYLKQSQQYVDCTVKTRAKPEQALKEAAEWYAQTKEPAARHCEALARYNLGQYKEAAELLEDLSKNVGDDQAQLKTSIMTQAAYSWRMIKNEERADDDYKSAIAIALNNNMNEMASTLLYERALMNNGRRQNLLAMQDLDHVISMDDKNVDARMLRAKIYEEMDNPGLAKEDYAAVLKAKPDNENAANNLKRLGGIVPEISPVPPKPKLRTKKAEKINTNKPVAVPKPSGVDSKEKKTKAKITKKSSKSKSSKKSKKSKK